MNLPIPSRLQSASDCELLDAYVTAGSQAAFEEIVRRNLSLVYGVALRRLGDRHLAEDVTQSVFILLMRKAKSLRRESVLGAWLVRAALFQASDVRKREAHRQARERRAAMEIQARNPAENQPDAEGAAWIDEALTRLSAADRRAVMLRYVSGMSGQDAAAVLGISENACRQRVHRGIERLRKFLRSKGVSISSSGAAGMLAVLHIDPPQSEHLIGAILGAASGIHLSGSASALLVKAKSTAAVIFFTAATTTLIGLVVARVYVDRHRTIVIPMPAQTPSPPAALGFQRVYVRSVSESGAGKITAVNDPERYRPAPSMNYSAQRER